MDRDVWTPGQTFADGSAEIAGLSGPFSRSDALDLGLTDHRLRQLTAAGHLRRPFRGVYVPSHLPDSVELRLATLGFVSNRGGIVVDGTASWVFLGDDALAPGEHLTPRDPTIFDRRGHHHTERTGLATGARGLLDSDIIELHGALVTTPLRTACDVLRLESPIHGLAIADLFEKAGLATGPEMSSELDRFRGYRHVRRARTVATWVDGRSDSFGESGLRYRWRETPGLPVPIPQVPVERPDGRGLWFLDLGLEDIPFGAEYDGEAFHGPEQAEYDSWRRRVMRGPLGLTLEIFDHTHVLGRRADAGPRIASALRELLGRRRVIDLGRVHRPAPSPGPNPTI